jgi:hypothetical protein
MTRPETVRPIESRAHAARAVARLGVAGAALALCLGHESSARAAEAGPDTMPIHILAVLPVDTADDQAEALTKALRSAVRKQLVGWALAEGDYSLEVLSIQLKCADPPDVACATMIADQIKADRLVWASVKTDKGNAEATLNLWVRGQGNASEKLTYTQSLQGEDETLVGIAKAGLDKLTGGPPKGSVRVRAGSANGQVFADGQALGALKNGDGTFPIPVGSRKIVVKSPGFADAETTIVVKPGGLADVSLTLVPVSSGAVDPKLIVGIAGIAVGVGGVVMGIVGGTQVSGAQETLTSYKSIYADDLRGQGLTDACEGPARGVGNSDYQQRVKTSCDSGKTGEVLQAVGYPLAAVAGGVGIALVASSVLGKKTPAKAGWTLTPYAGPQGGALSLGLKF